MDKPFPSPDVSALEAMITEAYLVEERRRRGRAFLEAIVYEERPELLAHGFVEGEPWRQE